MRAERQQLVQDLVESLVRPRDSSSSHPRPSGPGPARAEAAALRRALKLAEQPVRDPPLSLAEARDKFNELALKNRIGLHGEVAQAEDKVLARLVEVVTAQSEEHKKARREYLDYLVEGRARHPDGHWPHRHGRTAPLPPPIELDHLPDLLQLMLLLSAQPTQHTRLQAVQILLGEGVHAADYLAPAERAQYDHRRAEELLAVPAGHSEDLDLDVRGQAEDEEEDSALDSDKWSTPESDSDEDWLALNRSPNGKPQELDSKEEVQLFAPSLAEQLLDKMTSWPTYAQPYGWQPQFEAENDALAQFRKTLQEEEDVGPTRPGVIWGTGGDEVAQIAVPSQAKLDQVSAMREMVDSLVSFGAGAKVVHRGINHMTRTASDAAWDRVERVRSSVDKVYRYAQGLTSPVLVDGGQTAGGPVPPFAAQALGDGLATALHRWDVWLGKQDAFIVCSLTQQEQSPEPNHEYTGVRNLTLTDFLPRMEARAESLVCLASLLTLEEEDSVALADKKMDRIDPISVLNRLQALLGMRRAERTEAGGTACDSEPVAWAVSQDLASCYAAVVMPYLKEILYWLHLGAPFHWGSTQHVLALHLFRPNRALVASDEAFWTRGWRYASPLDSQAAAGDTSVLRPAPLLLVPDAPDGPDQSAMSAVSASAAPVLDTQPHVPLFLAAHADAVLQTGLSVGLLRTFDQADDAQSEATWRAACTSASRRLTRAGTGPRTDDDTEEDVPSLAPEPHALGLTLGSPRWAGRGLSPPSSPGASSYAGTQPDAGMEDEDVLSVVEGVMSASLGLVRLAQKRARDAFMLPPPDGSDLPAHLAALHGLMLFRQGDMQIWTDQVFSSLDETDGGHALAGLAGALDPASLLAALREATVSSPSPAWLDMASVSFRLLPSPAPTLTSATVVMDPWTASGRYSLAHIGRIVPAYHVPWPLTYVITQRETATYAHAFSLLLTLQWARRLLTNSVLDAGGHDKKDLPLFYALRHNLLFVLSTLMAHFDAVANRTTVQIQDALGAATSVAELVAAHRAAVDEMHAQLLLPPRQAQQPPSAGAGMHWSARSMSMDTSQLSFSFVSGRQSLKSPTEAVRTILSLCVQLVQAHDVYHQSHVHPAHRRRHASSDDNDDESDDDDDDNNSNNSNEDDLDPSFQSLLHPDPVEPAGQDYESQLQMLETAVAAALSDLTYGLDRTVSRRARLTTAALNDLSDPKWGLTRDGEPEGERAAPASAGRGAAALLAQARDARETMQALASALRGR